MTLLVISFLAGVLTVLAPCILPLLPVIVGSSVAGQASARRAGTIVVSLGLSIVAFTLLLKVSTAFVTIPAVFWQLLSGGLLLFFGLVTLFPSLWDRLPGVGVVYQSSNKLLGTGYQKKNTWGDIVMGAALGPVFSSCSPTYFIILAAVLPVHFATGITYLLSYVLGLCLFLFAIAYLGQQAVLWLGIASDPKGWFKKVVGGIFVLIGIAVIFGIDKRIEAALPAGAFGEIGIEQKLLSGQTSGSAPSLAPASTAVATSSVAGNASAPGLLARTGKALRYPQAPELVSPEGFINTDGKPITLSQYRGNSVVLVDFWDYSCINCQRTTPYLNAWYQKYKDQGLVIVGVHTPEFAFEQLQANVQAAVDRAGIKYPVVLDNKYQTWNAFQNQYWPREYLVDIDGYIVHDHAGEGEYDETEKAIQAALAERAVRLGQGTVAEDSSVVSVPDPKLEEVQSPETYFGSSRNGYLGNGTPGTQGIQNFTVPEVQELNKLYLGGSWNITPDYAEASAGSSVVFRYRAHNVYMVATDAHGPVKIKVLRDGVPVGAAAGTDVTALGEATIDSDRLYGLVHDDVAGVHTLEVQVVTGTLDAYTFTFG